MIDYAENLCEAMKIILEKQIKQLSFDITIDAIVVDATNAKNGMYVVSHDGATFTAYSTDSSFKEKDVVMVTIPQGNYDNQKMIIGKQVDKDKGEKPITYQSPFSQIVNLSGNLVYGDIGEKSLLANGGVGKTPSGTAKAQRVTIIEDNSLSEEYQTNGYTRLGLRADFSTWLNEFNVVSGNYGLALTLTFKNPDNNNDNIQAIYTFDSSEFFGDIYNFETYYNQEAVFDISDYSDYFLQGIKLEAYQLDNFETSNGEPLSYDNIPFSDISKPIDNIFIKEPFICLGTAVGEFKKDSIKIVTDSSSTYTNAENVKNLKLKWTHQDLNSKDIYVVQEDKIPVNYEIHWYKFKLGEESPDQFMDAHWIRLENGNNKINISFSPDPTNQTEQIRAIVLKTDNNNTTLVARSPIITFNNDNEVPNKANKIDANALGIQFTDSENGNYYYYDKTGKIIQKEKSQTTRILKPVFDNNINLENKKDLTLQPYTSIKWIFPKSNTMIIPLDPKGKDILASSLEENENENNISSVYTVTTTDKNYEISFTNNAGDTNKSILEQMKYRIDEYYSFDKSRNTIYLEVTINGQTYVSSVTMFFGIMGTSGSDYTIVVEWSEGAPVFDVSGDGDYSLDGSVKLLDPNGEPVTLNSSAQYTYSFEENEIYTGLEVEVNNSNSNFKISKNNNITMNDLYLLEVKLTGFGDYDLITKYPIALKKNSDSIQINGITGTTTIRYASDGTITLDDKNPYSISFQEEKDGKYEAAKDKEVGRWKIYTNNEVNHNFLPKLIDINSSLVENFILEIKNIKPNENFEITLLDLLISISKTQDSFNITSLNNSIETASINDSIPLASDDDISNFKNNLLTVNENQLTSLFSTLENKYSDDFSTVFLNKKINPILSPPSVYFKNIPLYGVQYILNGGTTILYTQPIYVYQDNYPSGTLNKWNGKDLILDENNGTIIANGFSAGKKEDDNTFTGVMIGNWSRTEAEDDSITTNTGIYGFHQGAMSYAFKDDGTAFIGKDGQGRIEFNGNNGIIKSAGFIPSTENQHGYGTLIDLNEGKLQLYSPISDKDKNQANQTDYYLTLSSIGTQNQPFLQISRKRDEVENFVSKYLNQYYSEYENLKSYTAEVYDQLIKFAQAYITYKISNVGISEPNTEMSELIPYTYYIMKNFEENSEIDINSLNSLDNFLELEDGVSIDNSNIWKFFYDSSERNALIDYEKNQYQTLLQNFYNDPTLSNLSTVNIFIKTYIDKYEINQYVQDSNIINYFFEDVSQLLSDDNEMSNNNYDEYTQQKKLIKFIFNNSQEPLIPGEKTGLNYYLYNFINFLPSPVTSFKKTIDSLEDIEACITALKSLDSSTFYIKNSNTNTYEEVGQFEKCYHRISGEYYPAYDFWDNGNNYKKVDNNYIEITEENFPIYYLKVKNNYIRFKYYYSTLTPVGNTTNAEIKANKNNQNFTREPILAFEKNRSYYYKNDNDDEYIYTNYCDNNNKYFYVKYSSPSAGDYKNITEFSANIDYYELIEAINNDNIYDSNPYQKYQFDFVSSVEEGDNLTETYVLKSFILPSDRDQQINLPFKVGNGISSLFDNYRQNSNNISYTTVTINTNQIYDITLRIDEKQQADLGLTKELWPIQGYFYVDNEDDGAASAIPYYASLSFTLRENVFGKDLLDSLIPNKYSFLNYSEYQNLKLISSSTSIRAKKIGLYIQEIEEKINNLNTALRGVLQGVPLSKQSNFKKDYSIGYLRKSGENKKSIILSLLTTNKNQIEELKEYLKNDVSNNFIFDATSWENDLIKIISEGGYITSKDYRPTMIEGDKVVRTPIQSQDSSSLSWRQGMKGFIIDLNNNKIVLGNNSQIEGIQSQYYPGQTNVTHRYFTIGTGVEFTSGQGAYSNRDVLLKEAEGLDSSYFIRAQADWSASKPSRDIFYVRWDGYVFCESLRVHSNFYFGTDSNRVYSSKLNNLPSGARVLYY